MALLMWWCPKVPTPKRSPEFYKKTASSKTQNSFYRYARFVAKEAHKIKAGEYVLDKAATPFEILRALQTGKRKEVRFTVPEGSSKVDIVKIIAAAGFSDEPKLIALMEDKELLKAFGVPERGADGQDSVPGGIEGYLFPDTYQFPKGTAPNVILKRMNKRLRDQVDEKIKRRMKEMGWSLHKTLTLAAIIEKETGKAFERPHISSVFHNRIKLGMKMQTDPTVIYGIQGYDGNIRKKDLRAYHPYNTYRIKGLPPGPIASPVKRPSSRRCGPTAPMTFSSSVVTTEPIFFAQPSPATIKTSANGRWNISARNETNGSRPHSVPKAWRAEPGKGWQVQRWPSRANRSRNESVSPPKASLSQ